MCRSTNADSQAAFTSKIYPTPHEAPKKRLDDLVRAADTNQEGHEPETTGSPISDPRFLKRERTCGTPVDV
ncbi:unnamed protein product [Mesocestoides corti]|uniref:Uncharacterized protein n=1 Tax=Mesocestoides corti TaxID=53468 RepID=A0A0R3UKF6_MESCO|nr:unnamed protein product [Mesocestoides corti]